jgi:hypothetical protein
MDETRHASQLRLKLREHAQAVQGLAEVALGRSALLPGSLYERRRRCGRRHCRCARGRPHRTLVLATGSKNARRIITLGGLDVETVRSLNMGYRRFRQTRSELTRVFREMLQTFDALGRQRTVGAQAVRDLKP